MAKKQFRSEAKRLLDLMINSIYTKKEIFLRELISNASDAIDKLAYIALTDDKVGMTRDDFAITIEADKKKRILRVSDNGIGMDQKELENDLGTIARSGSLEFKKELEKDAPDIIGQFGVGFYSVFMVAKKITVDSRKYGSDTAYRWVSSGADGYTVTPCEKDGVGTDVILELKEDTDDENYSRYLEEYELRSLVKKYSDFIRYPVKTDVEKTDYDDKGNKTATHIETETLNTMVPIWHRNKNEVSDEDTVEFYKSTFYDYEPPLLSIHANMEGVVTFDTMLFIPSKTPYDFYTKEYKKGLRLYSNGVMIMEYCEDLVPECFRFLKGIVDSQDLSLNISREMLQQDRQVSLIESRIEKKVKSELKKMLDSDREKYEKFFSAFGSQLKYGIVANFGAKRELLEDLLMFRSAVHDKYVTLAEYADAMPEGQEKIYCVSGESPERLLSLPQTDAVRKKGYDILLFTDEADEFVAKTLFKFREKEFCNIATEDSGLTSDEEKKQAEQQTSESKPVLDFVKETLGDKVEKVRLSASLGSHPVNLLPSGGVSFEMEKYLRRMNPEFSHPAGKILEINGGHPLFLQLKQTFESDREHAAKLANLLYYQGLLIADLPIENPTEYTDLVCGLIADKPV